MSPAASGACPLGMLLMSAVVALVGRVARQVVVAAAVSAAEMLPVVQVSALVEGDTRPSPAASEGCPLGMMLVTVVEAAAVQVAVQMAVVAALPTVVQVARLSCERGDTSPSPGGSVPRADFPLLLCPFPTLEVAAGTLALSSLVLEEALLGGWCGFSLLHAGPFFTLAGGGIGWSLASLGGTLAALMGAPSMFPDLQGPHWRRIWWLRCWSGLETTCP
ncbi:hypothetical protein NDU88_000885 [Pleurodeles waltl]|uniref:Secreted protein n=1 Tax=Pleurodeles waltl TaxID=8319 RepID=A0AAV7SBC4_PLEWA|nr:hypothetical protein NDU88_000885 [Pleurodeles waltl]